MESRQKRRVRDLSQLEKWFERISLVVKGLEKSLEEEVGGKNFSLACDGLGNGWFRWVAKQVSWRRIGSRLGWG